MVGAFFLLPFQNVCMSLLVVLRRPFQQHPDTHVCSCVCVFTRFVLPTSTQDRRADHKSVNGSTTSPNDSDFCTLCRPALPTKPDHHNTDSSYSTTVHEAGNVLAHARSISIRFHDITLRCSFRRSHKRNERAAHYRRGSNSHLTRHSSAHLLLSTH